MNYSAMTQFTARESLKAHIGARGGNAQQRQAAAILSHEVILAHSSAIVALHLCKNPPPKVGNRADHAHLISDFKVAKLDNYAAHAVAIRVQLKTHKGASIATFDAAYETAYALVSSALAGCAPKVRTAEELRTAEAKREASKAQKEADKAAAEKADKAAAEEKRLAERAEAFADGQKVAVLTVDAILTAIKSGQFTHDELDSIVHACGTRVTA